MKWCALYIVPLCMGLCCAGWLCSCAPEPGSAPPVARFHFSPGHGEAPFTVRFEDASHPGGAPIREWRWDFGDGETSEARHPEHVYAEPGKYTVRLTVYNGDGRDTYQLEDAIAVHAQDADTRGGTVYIAEFAAENAGGFRDEDGDTPDWLELHNPGATPVSLLGWSLTDDPAAPDKWLFPAMKLGPDERLVVFASGKDRWRAGRRPLHASFKLNREGEYLALYAPGNPPRLIQEFAPRFPQQRAGCSYGQPTPDDAPSYLTPPTPGEPNTGARAYVAIAEPPAFEPPRGFYSGPVLVELQCANEDAVIRYTLDGTEPAREHGTPYEGPLSLSENAVLRAVAYTDNQLASAPATSTYLVGESPARRSLPALSLVGPPGKAFYAPDGVMAIVGGEYTDGRWSPVEPDDYNHPMRHGRAYERAVSAEVLCPRDNSGFQTDCGIRVHGSDYTRPTYRVGADWTVPGHKPSFRLYFREEYGNPALEYPLFDGYPPAHLRYLILRAGTHDAYNPFLTDELVRRVFGDMGHVVSRGAFANLFINGEYKGYYNLAERYREPFFDTRIGGGEWEIWKESGPETDLTGAWWELMALCRTGDFTTLRDYAELRRRMDIGNFIDYLILEVYAANLDWPHSNWVMARRVDGDGRFRFYVWDAELSMRPETGPAADAFYDMPGQADFRVPLNEPGSPVSVLYQAARQSPVFRRRFSQRLHRHFAPGGALHAENLRARFEELRQALAGVLPDVDLYIRDVWIPGREAHVLEHFRREGLYEGLAQPLAPALGTVVVSEVLAHSDTGSDFVELLNTSGAPVALGGWFLSDDPDQPFKYEIAGGIVLAPHGRVVFTEEGHFGNQNGAGCHEAFALRESGEEVVLVCPDWRSGAHAVYVREFDAAAADVSWGRFENGTGPVFVPLREPTPGIANSPPRTSPLVLTELAYHLDKGGTEIEYVEVVNAGGAELRLGGDAVWAFTDGIEFVFPDTVLAPGARLVVGRGQEALRLLDVPAETVAGTFQGRLRNSGERVVLGRAASERDAARGEFAAMDFVADGDPPPWPAAAAGPGLVLCRKDPALPGAIVNNWYAAPPTPGRPNQSLEQPAAPAVVFSEIMYHPATGGDAAQYIELHNTGDAPVQLAGWRLAGGVRFVFPECTLVPGAYLVVAAAPDAFREQYPEVKLVLGGWRGALSRNGEFLVLADANGYTVESLHYADEGEWAERARVNDLGHAGWVWRARHDGDGRSLERVQPALPAGSGANWAASQTDGGSPGRANTAAQDDIAPLLLKPAHAPALPRSTDPVLFSVEVTDEKDAGLAASVYLRESADAPWRQVALAEEAPGYFAAEAGPFPEGAVVEYYYAAEDASGNTRTWPPPTAPDGEQNANAFVLVSDKVSPAAVPRYVLAMRAGDRQQLLEIGDGVGGDHESDAQMNATFFALVNDAVEVRHNVGVRIRGHSNRTNPPNSYRVNFVSDAPFEGRRALALNSNNTWMQILGSALFREAGVPAAEAWPVRLSINGENDAVPGERMYGCYAALEVFDSAYTDRDFGNGGNLYRCREGAHLRYEGPAPEAYQPYYFKQTNRSEDDWRDLIQLVNTLGEAPFEELPQSLETVADADEWWRFFAADALLGNHEAGISTGKGGDYALYFDSGDGEAHFIPHDLDNLLEPRRSILTYGLVPGLRRVFAHPGLVQRYYSALETLGKESFAPARLRSVAEEALADFVPAQARNRAVAALQQRRRYVLGQIRRPFAPELGLPALDGTLYTAERRLELAGAADAARTQAVRVNGQQADWSPRQGVWSLNRLFVPRGALWYFLDAGRDLGPDWAPEEPPDEMLGAPVGPAPLGYGFPDVSTAIGYGEDAARKHTTTYFLHVFHVRDMPQEPLLLRLDLTGGAEAYINGGLVGRVNLPETGPIEFGTAALAGGRRRAEFPMQPDRLRSGTNTLAVAVHRHDPGGEKLRFDAELIGPNPLELEPGPNTITLEALDKNGGPLSKRTLPVYQGPAGGMAERQLELVTRSTYLPAAPLLIEARVLDASGRIDRTLWDGVAWLESATPGVRLDTQSLELVNGRGCARVRVSAAGGFVLRARLGEAVAEKAVQPMNAAAQAVSGSIAGPEAVWEGVVRVEDTVVVPRGCTLTLGPGALVLLAGAPPGGDPASIQVFGTVRAEGTREAPVTLVAAGAAQPWGELRHEPGARATYRWTQFSGGGNAAGAGHTERGPLVRAHAADIAFEHCLFADLYGKAVASGQSAHVALKDCLIARAAMGVELLHSFVDIQDTWLVGMQDAEEADGIYILPNAPEAETARIQGCVLARGGDDAIDTWGARVHIEECILRDFADKAVSIDRGEVTLDRVLAVGNGFGVSAKALTGGPVPVRVRRSTFARNGTAFWIRDLFDVPDVGITFDIRGSILWRNDVLVETDYASENVRITYSVLDQPWPGEHNVVADPRFVAPQYQDYRLKAGSPAIDLSAPTGKLDPDRSRADAGFYPSPYGTRRVWHVAADSPATTPDGSSWETAYRDIQAAIDAAANAGEGEVWVRAGTYPAQRNPGVHLRPQVQVYGGFTGDAAQRSERAPRQTRSILDGGGRYCCVYGADDAVLDGFTLVRGKSDETEGGGGMKNKGVSPRVRNCLFRDNSAGYVSGGAMYNSEGAAPRVEGCVFAHNTAWQGGAVFNGPESAPDIVNCLFTRNTAERAGGAMHHLAARPRVRNCTLVSNEGGGIANERGAAAEVVNSILWDNAPEDFTAAPDCAVQVSHTLAGTALEGPGNLSAAPGFTAPDKAEFYLRPDSPCVDAGRLEGAPARDLLGRERPRGGGVDLGAFESPHGTVKAPDVPAQCPLDRPLAVFRLLLALFDANADGRLSREELEAFVVPPMRHPHPGSFFVIADSNGSQYLEADEWMANGLLAALYDSTLDRDRDDGVSVDELAEWTQDNALAARAVTALDRNGNGRVECGELGDKDTP